MKSPIRILDTGLMPAHWNIAMTAALAELHGKGAVPDTVRFHRYTLCVLLGRSQDAASAADMEYCRLNGIDIARRVTGGGAVFMSPGMLAWEVAVDRHTFGSDLQALTARISNGIAAGLSELGCMASFCPPNAIEVGGRKVSGSSGYTEGRSALLQGTVLITDERAVMARALRIPEAAICSGVTSLSEAIKPVPTLSSVVACITHGLSEALQRDPVCGIPSAHEVALCEALLRDDISDEFAMPSALPVLRSTG